MPCKWHGWSNCCTRNDFFNPKGPKLVVDRGSVLYIFCSVYKCVERANDPMLSSNEENYTFRGYDPELLTMLPASVRHSLGAVLTKNKGVSVDTLSSLERSIAHNSTFAGESSKMDESIKVSTLPNQSVIAFRCLQMPSEASSHFVLHKPMIGNILQMCTSLLCLHGSRG